MMMFALGFLGYSPDVFWSMTLREYKNALTGYTKKEKWNDRKHQSWIRAVAYNVYQLGFMFSKKQPKSIDAFWPLQRKTPLEYEKEKLTRKRKYKKFPDKWPL